jgi:hypothetical protein
MFQRGCILVGVLILLQMGGLAYAQSQSEPDRVVEQYITALSQGRFAEARTLTLESANLDGSIFGTWLFGGRSAGLPTATADLFLSQKFVAAFRYTITGTTPVGENQVYVTAVRASPDVAYLYEWAVLPKHDAAPYDIIAAIDTYLTKVNFPMEESRLRFTLIREVDVWFISAITDARFARLRQPPGRAVARMPADQTQADAAAPPDDVALEPPPQEPIATTTSTDVGRLLSDAQFHATLQGFNDTYRAPSQVAAAPADTEPGKRPFWKRLARRLRLKKPAARVTDADLQRSLQNIREAIGRYMVNHNDVPPEETLIRDWQSLRQLVSQHGRKRRQIPDSEAAAGFRFVNYLRAAEGYVLQVEFLSPQNGFTHAEITPYRVIRTY